MTDENSRYVRTPIAEEANSDRRTTFEQVLLPYSLEDAVLEAQR